MADYGVNIKVGVQGQSNAKNLSDQIREIVRGIEDADKAFSRFSSNLKSFDQRRQEREVNKELDNRAEKYRKLERLQRQLLANDNSALKAVEKRAKLEEHISKTISIGRARRQAARQQFLAGDPGQYAAVIGPQPDRIAQIRKITAAEEQGARQVSAIKNQLFRKLNRTQIDLLQDRIKRELDGQQDIFQNMMRLNKIAVDDFDKRLKQRVEAQSEAVRLTGQASPIGGAVGIPGSPAALAAIERAQRIKAAQGSALIGGAFPLLFGQGLGAAAGGAFGGFGGGLVGGEFGFGLSLVGTQIGSLVDQFIASANELGQALNPLTANIDAVTNAAGLAATETQKFIQQLEEEAGEKAALAAATSELALVIGTTGVDALQEFGDGSLELSRQFGVAMTQMQSVVAKFLNSIGLGKGLAQAVERTTLLRAGLANTEDKRLLELQKQRQQALTGAAGAVGGVATLGIDQEIVERVKELRKENSEEIKKQAQLAAQNNDIEIRRAGILRDQLTIQELGGNLLNDRVYALERALIFQEAALKAAEEGLTPLEEKNIFAERDLELQKLSNQRQEQAEAMAERRLKLSEKQQKAFERNEQALARLEARGAQQRESEEAAQVKRAGDLIDTLHREREARLAILNGTTEQVEKEHRIQELMKGQDEGMRGIVESYVQLESAENERIKRAEELNRLYASIGQTIETGVVDMITAATDKTKSLADSASNALRQIGSQLLRFGISSAFGALGGDDGVGVFSRLFPQERRALGGSVSGNRPYLVGERGPELFVPGAQGNIVPNHAMGGANVVVNVDASGTQTQGNQPNAKALGAAIGAAVQAELVKQKRPGGLLS